MSASDELEEAFRDMPKLSSCTCTPNGCGGDTDPDDRGYCLYCGTLDPYEHCPQCDCEDCG